MEWRGLPVWPASYGMSQLRLPAGLTLALGNDERRQDMDSRAPVGTCAELGVPE